MLKLLKLVFRYYVIDRSEHDLSLVDYIICQEMCENEMYKVAPCKDTDVYGEKRFYLRDKVLYEHGRMFNYGED